MKKQFTYQNNILAFPCGIEVEINKQKLKDIYKIFKLENEFEEMIKIGYSEIPQWAASQIRQYLT